MRIDDLALFEQFVDARREAVQLTDQYHEIREDDPRRPAVWQQVVVQTEAARVLLESWLQSRRAPAPAQLIGKG